MQNFELNPIGGRYEKNHRIFNRRAYGRFSFRLRLERDEENADQNHAEFHDKDDDVERYRPPRRSGPAPPDDTRSRPGQPARDYGSFRGSRPGGEITMKIRPPELLLGGRIFSPLLTMAFRRVRIYAQPFFGNFR
jgi:hypothetical protein